MVCAPGALTIPMFRGPFLATGDRHMQFPRWFSRRRSNRRQQSIPRKPATVRLGLEALEERAIPAAGDLDLGFHFDGKQTFAFQLAGSDGGNAHAMAIDSQGRIVLAGSVGFGVFPNDTADFAVARLN